MKRIKKFLLGNIKTVVAFILGIIISGTTIYAATILFASDQVSYDNTSSGMTATNVQGAIDELYEKANTWIDPKSNYHVNKNRNLVVNSSELKLIRNGVLYTIKNNNYNVEKDHIQQIFSDVSCYDVTGGKVCSAIDFYCSVGANNSVYCRDNSDNSECQIKTTGEFYCKDQISTNMIVKMNTTETILATPEGMTIKRGGNLYHISANNWSVEKDHIQQIFSDISCTVSSTQVLCNATDAGCLVYNGGSINCVTYSPSSSCSVDSSGTVNCN